MCFCCNDFRCQTEILQTVDKQQILIVDDERTIREMVCLALENSGYDCLQASDAHKAEALIRYQLPDLVLLDWMMPGVSGVDFARRLRKNKETSQLPIIMLTAKVEEDDMIRGLDSGADDYLTKPFSTREMLSRIKALLRRSGSGNDDETLQIAGLLLDRQTHRVYGNGNKIELGPTEFKLLQFFMENPERVYSREQVLDHVWGENVYIETRTVDVHIRRLRKALEASGHDRLVQTVRGSGYRFSTQP
jgi:two-component system phosphate regulon response regulator PhoB